MAFRKETFGTLENGAVITKYILTNEHGLKAAFYGSWRHLAGNVGSGQTWHTGRCGPGI